MVHHFISISSCSMLHQIVGHSMFCDLRLHFQKKLTNLSKFPGWPKKIRMYKYTRDKNTNVKYNSFKHFPLYTVSGTFIEYLVFSINILTVILIHVTAVHEIHILLKFNSKFLVYSSQV